MLFGIENILLVVVGVGFLILVHELGHFIAAKIFKVRAEVFSIGFGPAIISRKIGETEYKIAPIPLGGYVKLAGEMVSDSPPQGDYEFRVKPAWQRLIILLAGVFMNFIIAFPLCILSFTMGVSRTAPVIGLIPATLGKGISCAEWDSPLLEGDRILKVDGKEIKFLEEYLVAVSMKPAGSVVKVEIERNGKKMVVPVKTFGMKGEYRHHLGGYPTNIVEDVGKSSIAEEIGVKRGDILYKLNNEEIGSIEQLMDRLEKRVNEEVSLVIKRPIGKDSYKEIELKFKVKPASYYYILPLNDLLPPIVGKVKKGMSAERAGLEKNDVILEIGGKKINNWKELHNAIVSSAGKEVEFKILKQSDNKVISKMIAIDRNIYGDGRIGIAPDYNSLKIYRPPQDWKYLDVPLEEGDIIVEINGKEVSELRQVPALTYQDTDKPIELKFRRGEKLFITRVLPVKTPLINFGTVMQLKTVLVQYSLLEAIQEGFNECLGIVNLTLLSLYKLVVGDVSPKELVGPIGIFYGSYKVAQKGISQLFWFLALLAINLAIINILPIPVLDGGYILFLAIEKIRGKPISEKLALILNYVFFFFLISLIFYTMYNDVGRLIGFGTIKQISKSKNRTILNPFSF